MLENSTFVLSDLDKNRYDGQKKSVIVMVLFYFKVQNRNKTKKYTNIIFIYSINKKLGVQQIFDPIPVGEDRSLDHLWIYNIAITYLSA